MAVAAHDDLDRRPAGTDVADDMAQHQRHLGPVRRLAGAQDDRDRLAGRRLVDVDRQKAAAVVIGVEQRQLLAAVNPSSVSSISSRMRRGTSSKLSQNNSTIAAIMRLSAVAPGCEVLQPADSWLRAQIIAALGQPPDRHLEGWIGFERVAVVAVGIARCDQQRAVADHLGKAMPHPFRIARVLDARGQAFGDLQPLLDRRQQ